MDELLKRKERNLTFQETIDDKAQTLLNMNDYMRAAHMDVFDNAQARNVAGYYKDEGYGLITDELHERLMRLALLNEANAETLEKSFPGIKKEAEDWKQSYIDQSQISGAEKRKNDFWGTKKRAAKNYLVDLDKQKQIAAVNFAKMEHEKMTNLKEQSSRWIHGPERVASGVPETEMNVGRERILKKRIKNETDPLKKQAYQSCLNIATRTMSDKGFEGESAADFLAREEGSSEYEFENSYIANAYVPELERKVLAATGKKLKYDSYARDMSRFAMSVYVPGYSEREAPLDEKQKEAKHTADVAKVMKMTNDVNIAAYGKPMFPLEETKKEGEAEKKENATEIVEVSKDRQKQAFTDVKTLLDDRVAIVQNYEKAFPFLFYKEPNVDVVFKNYVLTLQTYKMLQVCQKIIDLLLDSEGLKLLSKDELEAFGKTAVYLKTMKGYLQLLNSWADSYASWANKNDPTVPAPKMTSTYDSYSAEVVGTVSAKINAANHS